MRNFSIKRHGRLIVDTNCRTRLQIEDVRLRLTVSKLPRTQTTKRARQLYQINDSRTGLKQMELGDAGLNGQPFPAHGSPLAVSSYAAHRKAVTFLATTYGHRHGLGILQGPTLSGKTTVVRQFLHSLPAEVSTAYIDARGMRRRDLLASLLDQFGYSLELDSISELSSMVRVFGMQQTAAGNPPVIAIDNCQEMDAELLPTLCEIADVRANRQNAFRIVMACQRNVEALIGEPELRGIAARVTGIHRLRPMAMQETRDYLYAKLYAAGAADPGKMFPPEVCADMHMAAGGWPGVVDRLAAFALSRARQLPITSDLVERRRLPEDMREAIGLIDDDDAAASRPRIYVSLDGELKQEIDLQQPRLLIGRSNHNDLPLDSRFVSRHHALLVSHGASTLLMDLNSTNGSFVNSRRISNHVMRHEDVISLGSYRLKFMHPAAERQFELNEAGFAETVIMKTLEDMRHMLSGESSQTMPQEALRRAVGDKSD